MYDRRLRTSPTGCRLARMPGRIEFVILRTARLPPVLPTPPHGNAVAFSSRPEYAYLERTCTSDQTRSQTVHPIQLVWMVNEIDGWCRLPALNLLHHSDEPSGVEPDRRSSACSCQSDSPSRRAGWGPRPSFLRPATLLRHGHPGRDPLPFHTRAGRPRHATAALLTRLGPNPTIKGEVHQV